MHFYLLHSYKRLPYSTGMIITQGILLQICGVPPFCELQLFSALRIQS